MPWQPNCLLLGGVYKRKIGPENLPPQKERMVVQPSRFRDNMLNFRGVSVSSEIPFCNFIHMLFVLCQHRFPFDFLIFLFCGFQPLNTCSLFKYYLISQCVLIDVGAALHPMKLISHNTTIPSCHLFKRLSTPWLLGWQVARHGGKGKGHHRYPSAPITVPNCWQHLSSVDAKKSFKKMESFLKLTQPPATLWLGNHPFLLGFGLFLI